MQNQNMQKEIPLGVKIIAVLNYIGGGVGILGGIFFIIAAFAFGLSQIPFLGSLGTFVFIAAGIIVMGMGVLSIFIGRGLWKGKNWARVVTIIFSIMGVLMVIIYIVMGGGILTNIVTLLYSAVVGGYLLFSKKVKLAFSKSQNANYTNNMNYGSGNMNYQSNY